MKQFGIVPLAALTIATCFAATSSAQVVVIHDESLSGDLSNNPLAPTPFTLVAGGNNIIGSVGDSDSQDWVRVNVPAGLQMTGLLHVSYSASDPQGFLGFDDQPTFTGSPFTPSSYQGYAHFGLAATNGNLPTTNTVGLNMLTIMANPAAYFAGQEPQGVTLPLGPGAYTFLFQQLGNQSDYEFSFQVATVPEPTSVGLMLVPLGGWLIRRLRRT